MLLIREGKVKGHPSGQENSRGLGGYNILHQGRKDPFLPIDNLNVIYLKVRPGYLSETLAFRGNPQYPEQG